jgi:hypothetical protein
MNKSSHIQGNIKEKLETFHRIGICVAAFLLAVSMIALVSTIFSDSAIARQRDLREEDFSSPVINSYSINICARVDGFCYTTAYP